MINMKALVSRSQATQHLTVSAVGRVVCASKQGGVTISEPFYCKYHYFLVTFDTRISCSCCCRPRCISHFAGLLQTSTGGHWNGTDSRQIYYCPDMMTGPQGVPPVTSSSNLPSITASTSVAPTSPLPATRRTRRLLS